MRKIVSIDDLSEDSQLDIVENLQNLVPEFETLSIQDIKDNILDQVTMVPVILTTVNPAKIINHNRNTSQLTVEKLKKLIENGVELDPILLNKGKFLDGGHRCKAYYELGLKEMPAVDIGHLIHIDWKAWLAGEDIPIKVAQTLVALAKTLL